MLDEKRLSTVSRRAQRFQSKMSNRAHFHVDRALVLPGLQSSLSRSGLRRADVIERNVKTWFNHLGRDYQ